MEDRRDTLPPELARQWFEAELGSDSSPPASSERMLYADEVVHSGELIVDSSDAEPDSQRTPRAGWMRDIPPPLPRPS